MSHTVFNQDGDDDATTPLEGSPASTERGPDPAEKGEDHPKEAPAAPVESSEPTPTELPPAMEGDPTPTEEKEEAKKEQQVSNLPQTGAQHCTGIQSCLQGRPYAIEALTLCASVQRLPTLRSRSKDNSLDYEISSRRGTIAVCFTRFRPSASIITLGCLCRLSLFQGPTPSFAMVDV